MEEEDDDGGEWSDDEEEDAATARRGGAGASENGAPKARGVLGSFMNKLALRCAFFGQAGNRHAVRGHQLCDAAQRVAAGRGAPDRPAPLTCSPPCARRARACATRVAGSSALTREDLQPALDDMQRKLMERNVAEEIAVQVRRR